MIPFPHCQTRHDLLKWATSLGLSFAIPALDLRAATRRGTERPRSLITVWLSGGPSQLETRDPHPGTRTGGPTKAIATSIPGVDIACIFPKLAEIYSHQQSSCVLENSAAHLRLTGQMDAITGRTVFPALSVAVAFGVVL